MHSSKHRLLEKLTEVKIPKELARFWKELKSSKLEDQEFYYKYFGKVIPMSLERMNKYSSLAPVDGDRYTFYKKIEELKKQGEISKEEENQILQNSHWDPFVMTIHLRNELKKYCQVHYIKYVIPIATTHGSMEIVFVGFTESKRQDGIFYYNATFQNYPIFICKTLQAFISDTNVELSRTEKLVEELGDEYCYEFSLNEDFELDEKEVNNILKFTCNSFKKAFNKEMYLIEDNSTIELVFEYRGFDRIQKFKKTYLKHNQGLQMFVMSINNSITEFDKNYLNNYKYYLTEKTIQLLHRDQAVKFARNGLIKPYSKNPIPDLAYTSNAKHSGKYDAELLEMIKDRNWSQVEIDRFLDIYGDIGFKNKYKE